MITAAEYEVIPECSLRSKSLEYILGMHICQTISLLQRMSRSIKGVELLYSHDAPDQEDVVVNSTQEGIKLVFDAESQLLKMIEIYDTSKITLRYCSNIFSVPYEKTTVEQVEQAFGATHPGIYDSSLQMYILSWRGISFAFPAESSIQPFQGRGIGSLQFSNGTSPVVAKICIFPGSSASEIRSIEMPLSCYNGNCYTNSLEVLRLKDKTVGISIDFSAETFECTRFAEVKKKNFSWKIFFGDSTEHVMALLGSPNRVFYKNEDKMRIHLPSDQRLKIRTSDRADFFYNYFTLGMDILFDGEMHKVKKFILHTNFPGHYDFGIYFRCNFTLNVNSTAPLALELESVESDEASKVEKSLQINAFTKWHDIYDLISDPCGDLFGVEPHSISERSVSPALSSGGESPAHSSSLSFGGAGSGPTAPMAARQCPVVLNRTNASHSSNPFGSTFCYCYQDVIFEVMPNNYIASLMLFDDSTLAVSSLTVPDAE